VKAAGFTTLLVLMALISALGALFITFLPSEMRPSPAVAAGGEDAVRSPARAG